MLLLCRDSLKMVSLVLLISIIAIGSSDGCRPVKRRKEDLREWRWVHILDGITEEKAEVREDVEEVSAENGNGSFVMGNDTYGNESLSEEDDVEVPYPVVFQREAMMKIHNSLDVVAFGHIDRELGLNWMFQSSTTPRRCGVRNGPEYATLRSLPSNCGSYTRMPRLDGPQMGDFKDRVCSEENVMRARNSSQAERDVLTGLIRVAGPNCPDSGKFLVTFYGRYTKKCCSYKIYDVLGNDGIHISYLAMKLVLGALKDLCSD
jgi:hypothetical protein